MTISTEGEETKLHVATRLGDVRLVREALRQGCDPNSTGLYGCTALHEAAASGNIEIALVLLNSKANPNFLDPVKRCSPLHLAAKNGKLEVVKLLVDNGAQFDLRNADRKTPIDVAENECQRYLESKRVENLVRHNGKHSRNQSSEQMDIGQMYRRPSGSPAQSWQHQRNQSFSQSVDSFGSTDSDESLTADNQPGTGDIKVWFEFNKSINSLKIAVWEVKDLRVPLGHNYSHLYVKCYLLPDKNKATKQKTGLKKLGRLDSEYRSSSSTSTISEESDSSAERGFADRMRASLSKKTPHLQKKKRDRVKCIVQCQDGDNYGRITTPVQEAFCYDREILRKVNMSTTIAQLTICGKNRRTGQGVPIASVSIPLSDGININLAEYFPLQYQTGIPAASSPQFNSLNSSTSGVMFNGLDENSTVNTNNGPENIKLWFEYNVNVHSLKIAVWELKDLKLPAGHNFGHLYVKCYLLPDKNKATKLKTAPKRFETLSSGLTSSSIQEAFFYVPEKLSKVNMDIATAHLSVCGKQRLTGLGVSIATVSIPLSTGINIHNAQWFSLQYQTEVQVASLSGTSGIKCGSENSAQLLSSVRNNPFLSMSMPMVPTTAASATTMYSGNMQNSQNPQISASTFDIHKKGGKKAGRFKFFKKESTHEKAHMQPNHRYKNVPAESSNDVLCDQVMMLNSASCGRLNEDSGAQSEAVNSRSADMFTATGYQNQRVPPYNNREKAKPVSRQLIYSRALMNDQKRAANSNDMSVEDFNGDEIVMETPMSCGNSRMTHMNKPTLAF